ncbi:hypothetical protein PBRA_001122, partial [Plasmodiophora brassicae]
LRGVADGDVMEVGAAFGRAARIPDGATVMVEFRREYALQAPAAMVAMQPMTADDWEIISATADAFEATVLEQADVVTIGAVIPFWVHQKTLVHLRVVSCDGGMPFARLSANSRIAIAPVVRVQAPAPVRPSPRPCVRLRIERAVDTVPQRCVAVRNETLEQLGVRSGGFVDIASCAGGQPPRTVQAIQWQACAHGHVHVHSLLLHELGLERFQSVIVTPSDPPKPIQPSDPESTFAVTVRPVQFGNADGNDCRKDGPGHLRLDQEMLVLCPGALISTANGHCVWSVQDRETSIVLGPSGQIDIVAHVSGDGPLRYPLSNVATRPTVSAAAPDIVSTLVHRLRACLLPIKSPTAGMLAHLRNFSGVCLSGVSGIGKTHVMRAVADALADDANVLAALRWIDCASMASDKADDIKGAFRREIAEAVNRSPAIIAFDDLDQLLPVAKEHDNSGNTLRASRLAEHLSDLLLALRAQLSQVPVVWMCTARSFSVVHGALRLPGVFTNEVAISAPDAPMRAAILHDMLSSIPVDVSNVSFESFGADSEGYVAQDIKVVAQRAVHRALSPEHIDIAHLASDHLRQAMGTYVPLALRDVDLRSSDTRWEDIGGLEEVRSTLRETLELPTRFAPMFAALPLKLRSGLLLYGPPGCGKTMLASAVARECGLNFISVKGPELLNKYIGASEQAVRDLFARAAAAAPSILFFDEFDAIAPRRGADSTGVTDRVVNQMLCHLDGVEHRDGVYVLGATSRPDLVDPALLRPGRLDKCLYCGIPDYAARLSILHALSRNMHLHADVDLDLIAERSENFTGADLQGVLNTAHLSAVHEALDRDETDAASVVVRQEHITLALSNTRLSVSASDRNRFQSIYAAFVGSRSSDFSLQFREGRVRLRTALA